MQTREFLREDFYSLTFVSRTEQQITIKHLIINLVWANNN